MDSNVSSLKEVDLKSEIGEKVSNFVSSGSQNGVKMNTENSRKEHGDRISGIDDSIEEEKKEDESKFIHQQDIKENQEISGGLLESVIEVQNEVELLSEVQDSVQDVFQVQSVIAGDNSSVMVQRQDILDHDPKSISQFEDGVKMNPDTLFECEEEGRRITAIHDSTVQGKQETKDEIFQVQDVIADDEHLILVVERQQIVENVPNSMSESQNLVGMSNASVKFLDKKTSGEMIGAENYRGRMGGSGVKRMAETETQIVDRKLHCSEVKPMPVNFPASTSKTGNSCGRKENVSIALGKTRVGSCSENIKQETVRMEKCSRRNGKDMEKSTEISVKKNVLSIGSEARNVCLKKADGSKRSYSRKEMQALRFVNSYEQRQIWREIYTGLGPVVARELNAMAVLNFHKGMSTRNGGMNNQHQHAGKKRENSSILGMSYFLVIIFYAFRNYVFQKDSEDETHIYIFSLRFCFFVSPLRSVYPT